MPSGHELREPKYACFVDRSGREPPSRRDEREGLDPDAGDERGARLTAELVDLRRRDEVA